jgi:hypothetical protein
MNRPHMNRPLGSTLAAGEPSAAHAPAHAGGGSSYPDEDLGWGAAGFRDGGVRKQLAVGGKVVVPGLDQ